MTTNYPSSIDSFTDPTPTDALNSPSHSGQHSNINDAMLAVQDFLGTSGAPKVAPLTPSGDATGATDATNINAILSAGKVANLDGTYYIDEALLLAGANGLNCTPRTIINWTGAANTTAIGTVALTSNTQAPWTGMLSGGTLFYPIAQITEAMKCIYIALPYPSETITMAVSTGASESDQGDWVSGAYAYDLDGCANPGIVRINANVYGIFQAGFRVRCNHVTIDSCGSGVGAHHVEVDEDTTSFGSPLNVTLIGSNHAFRNSVSFLHLIKAYQVTVECGYNESGSGGSSNVVVLAESTFEGWCDIKNVYPGFDATYMTLYCTAGYVRYRTPPTLGNYDAAFSQGYDQVYVGQSSGVPIRALATSSVIQTALGNLALGTAFENTLPYDVWLTVYLAVTANTSLVVQDGVGPTSSPTQTTIITGTVATGIVPVRAKVPAGQYRLLSVSGTATDAIVGQYLEAV
jgi:hypothetical protein